MEEKDSLNIIRNKLFYGSADYTKNQPDLYLPHRYKILAPSQTDAFIEKVKESLADEPEVLLYVHLPFCFSECYFCNSYPHNVNRIVQDEYLENILKEIELFAARGFFKGRRAKGIYFGGGTPTSFSNHDIQRIIHAISSCIAMADNHNITTEAHPDTLADKKRIQELAQIGITRLSVGCQTFDQQVLSLCNRKNNEVQIDRIVKAAQDAGIAINIDMMTGLPGQTIDGVKKDLAILETIRPDAVEYIRHEIVNPLVIRLYKEHPELVVSNDTLFDMVYLTQEWMSANGYEQNGRFTSDKQWGYRYYWLKEMPIIAFGSRARSYTKTILYDKHEELSTYSSMIKKGQLPIGRYVFLTEREQMYRSLFLNLQFKKGLEIQQFQERFHADPQIVFAPLIAELSEYSCIRHEENSIRLTKYGAYFVEDVCDFITDTLLKEESSSAIRAPHSEGGRPSNRLN